MKRLRLGAILHFIIAIGHLGCLFALDEAFDAYGIKDVMYNMVFGHVWMLYALTFCLALAFALAGFYALSASRRCHQFPHAVGLISSWLRGSEVLVEERCSLFARQYQRCAAA